MSLLPIHNSSILPTITTFHSDGTNATDSASAASSAWPSANRAIYIHFALNQSIIVTKLFTANGSTASNSFDIGVFSSDGTKLVSTGATVQSGTTALQIVSVTATTLGPGQYYLGLAMNGTTGTFQSTSRAVRASTHGILTQSTAYPLPANATFATPASGYFPLFGLITSASLTVL